jgi:hypothetical protein
MEDRSGRIRPIQIPAPLIDRVGAGFRSRGDLGSSDVFLRNRRHPFVAACTALAVGLTLLLPSGAAGAAVPKPHVPLGLPAAIEPLAPYVGQSSCDPTVKPGTAKFAQLLTSTYPGTTWASAYQCGTDGSQSEHYEGRAIDWMVSYRNLTQRADANTMIGWLLSTDAHGNRFAMARRLGVMYLIWDNRMWGSWDGAWHPYLNCATHPETAMDNTCHRTHVHISLSWNGAMAHVSFWTKTVASADFGPCRPSDLNWAPARRATNPRPCPRYPAVVAPKTASTMKKNLVTYSGAGVHLGSSGPAVLAVQAGLHIPTTGTFDLRTQLAVLTMQRFWKLAPTGNMNDPSWRLLLARRR